MKPRLQVHYEERVRGKLSEQFGFDNPLRIPRIEKVVVNVGLGEAPKNPKLLDAVVEELGTDHRPAGCHHAGAQVDLELRRCAKGCPSGRRSRCAASACTSSSTA
jgi:hypothetical protein